MDTMNIPATAERVAATARAAAKADASPATVSAAAKLAAAAEAGTKAPLTRDERAAMNEAIVGTGPISFAQPEGLPRLTR